MRNKDIYINNEIVFKTLLEDNIYYKRLVNNDNIKISIKKQNI